MLSFFHISVETFNFHDLCDKPLSLLFGKPVGGKKDCLQIYFFN